MTNISSTATLFTPDGNHVSLYSPGVLPKIEIDGTTTLANAPELAALLDEMVIVLLAGS